MRSGSCGTEGLADCRGDLGAKQFDRSQHLCVWQRADADLGQEALVAKQLMLEENLFDDFVRAAH